MRRLIGAALLSGLTALSGCETNPSTGKQQLLLVSEDQVSQLGLQARPELIDQYGGQIQSQEVRSYINQVGQRLAQQVEPEYKDIKWQFTPLNSDVINAFALPPGQVFVTRGLLERLRSEAELASVLGHEMGHITARHVNERISREMLVQGLAQGASQVAGGSQGAVAQLVPLVVGLGGQGYLLKFSRDQESEADRQGLKYMTRAGYDPAAAKNVMRVLMQEEQSGRAPEFLSTHPDPQRRLNDIQKLIESQYAFTQGNPQFQTYPERFQQKLLAPLGSAGGDSGKAPINPSPRRQ